jgi:hypothetical protein
VRFDAWQDPVTHRSGQPVPDWLTCRDTVRELSGALSIDRERLAVTVARFNAGAVVGADPDFARGADRYDRYGGDPANPWPNPCLAPLDHPPFYGMPLQVGAFGTSGGVATDERTRALDAAGEVIGGLFAVGNVSAHPVCAGYPGAGGTLGPALTMGYLAGLSVGPATDGSQAPCQWRGVSDDRGARNKAEDKATQDRVLHEVRDGIARITLNRPEAANALAPEQRNRLIELFEADSQDPAVRVVLLRSTGKHFCSGADLGRIKQLRTEGADHVGVGTDRILTGALRLIAAILDCRKPVVCAVQGVAGGLGLHVALACDLIVAASTARFFEPLALRGLVMDGAGAYLLPRRIGMQRRQGAGVPRRPAARRRRPGLRPGQPGGSRR